MSQTKTVCAINNNTKEMVGFYILHPTNVGRCAHIANASYGVDEKLRGKGIGELLVKDCLACARRCGFKELQFNAVVSINIAACKLYEKLGFTT